jgi:NAD+ diphosphatase
MTFHPGFTGSPLDRADPIRNDKAAYDKILNDLRARVLSLDQLDPVIDSGGGLLWKPLSDVAMDAELVLLGLDEDRPHFVEIVIESNEPMQMRSPAIWRALSILPSDQAAIYGTARSLIDWHNNHRFCGACGGGTKVFRAGWGRKCDGCNKEHFPRTDPVVIMLVECEDMVLIGRQPRFPPKNYSALAGYLEPGESMEEAVRRELYEEAGVRAGAVRYIASQPWPFGGAQLMMACIAKTDSMKIVLDTNELEDAMWVTRQEVQAAVDGADDAKFNAPPPFAIAHSLLRAWLDGG